jgi:ubiquinone/menaquinone biosynthesis C-methylase UbiE
VVVPRIEPFLDVETILDIGPGHGRWTQFLRHRCRRLIVVDISPRCIDVCRKRFPESTNIEYCVNDGMSLAIAPDNSVDFIFSWRDIGFLRDCFSTIRKPETERDCHECERVRNMSFMAPHK